MVIVKRAKPLICSALVMVGALIAISWVLHTPWACVILSMLIVTAYFFAGAFRNDT